MWLTEKALERQGYSIVAFTKSDLLGMNELFRIKPGEERIFPSHDKTEMAIRKNQHSKVTVIFRPIHTP